MGLVIEERELGGDYVEGYFTADPKPAYMAIQRGVRPETRRCRSIEAHGYYRRPPRSLRKICYLPPRPDSIDEDAIRAMRPVVEEHISVAELRELKRSYRASYMQDAWWIAWDCGLHPYIVIALLRNLAERGELPTLN
jgi:hypothetical protein